MFPLGGVLFPSLALPLHVFEPRYRAMVQHCIDTEPEFGVVLITRGSEVGGGDVREGVGTVARIVEAAELGDGRWAIGTVGTRRIRVSSWLADDPYPQAEVEDWPDPEPAPDAPLAELYGRAVPLLRRVLALRSELDEPSAPATIEVTDDPALGSHQLAAVGPFGPADQQALLAAVSVEARLRSLVEMLSAEADFAAQRLAMG